jgi:hypothetical protein
LESQNSFVTGYPPEPRLSTEKHKKNMSRQNRQVAVAEIDNDVTTPYRGAVNDLPHDEDDFNFLEV